MSTEHADETAEVHALALDLIGDLGDLGDLGTGDPGALAWGRLASSGLTTTSLPEDRGGSGGTLADAAAVLSASARAGLSLPLVESEWLAGWLATGAGRPAPAGRATLASGEQLTVTRSEGRLRLAGTVPRVPWRHVADEVYVVLPAEGLVAVVALAADGTDPAIGLPTDTLDLDALHPGGLVLDEGADCFPVTAARLQDLEVRRSLARVVQIAGASAGVQAIAVRHARERVQFGRPLSGYQVIQHYLARIAACTHGVTVACAAALAAYADGGPAARGSVLAARAMAAGTVEEVTTLAHQVVGAIGTTREHPLHRRTMSMWAWREDAGNEYVQASLLADLALADHDLWAFLAPDERAAR